MSDRGEGGKNTVYVTSQVNIFHGKYEVLKVLSFEVPVYPPHPLSVWGSERGGGGSIHPNKTKKTFHLEGYGYLLE